MYGTRTMVAINCLKILITADSQLKKAHDLSTLTYCMT